MVSVTAAVQQKVRLVPAEASYDHAVRKNWVAVGAAAAQHQSLYDFLQMTRFASAHSLNVCVCVSEVCGLM